MDTLEYIKQKYYDLIPRSFKTKLDLFLFTKCNNRSTIGKFDTWEFNRFLVDDEILELYKKAWQLKGNESLMENGIKMSEIDKEIEVWSSENQQFIEELHKGYKILFITDYFPFSEFEALYSRIPEERVCSYCHINDLEIEQLGNKGKIYTKRERGFTMEIDRIEPNKEYTPNNCVLDCYWCNNAKSDEFSSHEFSENIGPGIQSVWKKRNL